MEARLATDPGAPADPALLPAAAALPAKAASKGRARAIFAAKVVITAGALAFTFSRMSLAALTSAVQRLSLNVVVLACAVTFVNLVLAGVRWRVLLAAYGAKDPPSIPFLARAQLVGHFYNICVPGGVTGDVVRGHATRDSFEGPLGGYMVVGIERFFGLAGLFTIGALALFLHPIPGVIGARWLAASAFAVAFVIVLVPIVGRTVGRRLPGRLGKWAAGLPVVTRPALLGIVLALSIGTQTLVALTGHLLVNAIAPQVVASQSLVLVPLATAATYVPSVAGLGPREFAFGYLFGIVGVSSADATAASLAFIAVQLIVAVLGGLVQLARPLQAKPNTF